jgi:hypothetical protein
MEKVQEIERSVGNKEEKPDEGKDGCRTPALAKQGP